MSRRHSEIESDEEAVEEEKSTSIPTPEDPIVIFGMGPTGIAAAIEATQAGRRVVIFDPRTEHLRANMFRLSFDTKNYLSTLSDGHWDLANASEDPTYKKITRRTTGEGRLPVYTGDMSVFYQRTGVIYNVKTKMVEKILLARLQELQAANPDQVRILRGTTASNVDTDARTITLKTGDTEEIIPYSMLVGADGARHSSYQMITGRPATETHEPLAITDFYRRYMVAHYRIKSEAGFNASQLISEQETTSGDNPPSRDELRAMGWPFERTPRTRFFISDNTVYVSGETPEAIAGNPDAEYAWTQLLLRYHLPQALITDALTPKEHMPRPLIMNQEEYKAYLEKKSAKRKIARIEFSTDLERAKDTVVPLPGGACYYPLGDCLQSAKHHTGSGAETALKEVEAWGQLLRGEITEAQYEEIIADILERTTRVIDAYAKSIDLAERQHTMDHKYVRDMKATTDTLTTRPNPTQLRTALSTLNKYLAKRRDLINEENIDAVIGSPVPFHSTALLIDPRINELMQLATQFERSLDQFITNHSDFDSNPQAQARYEALSYLIATKIFRLAETLQQERAELEFPAHEGVEGIYQSVRKAWRPLRDHCSKPVDLDLTGVDLSRLDLSGLDLTESTMDGTTKLDGTILSNCDLRFSDFSNLSLNSCVTSQSQFDHATFTNVETRLFRFSSRSTTDCRVDEETCQRSDISWAQLIRTQGDESLIEMAHVRDKDSENLFDFLITNHQFGRIIELFDSGLTFKSDEEAERFVDKASSETDKIESLSSLLTLKRIIHRTELTSAIKPAGCYARLSCRSVPPLAILNEKITERARKIAEAREERIGEHRAQFPESRRTRY